MSSAAEVRYSLGAIDQPADFYLGEDISSEEYEELLRAIHAISRLSSGFHYKLVERNYLDLESLHQFITITLSLGRDFATPHHGQLGEALMTSIVNWLTAMRLFLDHEETALKRRFGKNSAQVERFTAATAAAYDGRVGYRFAYRFRNFVQHCGLPASKIEVRPADTTGTRAKQSVDLLLDRDRLLDAYREWGPVKTDLRAMPPAFGLLPLASQAMDGVRDIHRVCTELRIDEALQHCEEVVAAVDRIEQETAGNDPALFRYTRDERGGLQLTPTMIPVDAARKLAAVQVGAEDREALWAEAPSSEPPAFDPAVVRERFHRDNRGVQALVAWLTEGGGTPDFFGAVNRIITEDESIEPLVTGLINVSALLAHMSAGALGTSAQGLVAGLLDLYGEFDRPSTESAAGEPESDQES